MSDLVPPVPDALAELRLQIRRWSARKNAASEHRYSELDAELEQILASSSWLVEHDQQQRDNVRYDMQIAAIEVLGDRLAKVLNDPNDLHVIAAQIAERFAGRRCMGCSEPNRCGDLCPARAVQGGEGE